MSAIIMLVIVAMWAAVLGPMWMRRHDAIYESRSVDKFSAAMRVLSRRPRQATGYTTVGGRAVMMPARPADASPISSVSVSGRAGDETDRNSTTEQLYRLRRNVGALILVDVFTLAIWAGVGSTPILALHLASDLLTAIAAVGLQQASAREQLRISRETRRRRVATMMAREQEVVAATAPRTRTAAPVWHDPLATRPSKAAQARAEAEAAQAAVEMAEAEERARKRALRLPATSTTQRRRTIDLTVPGAWRESVDVTDVDDQIRQAAMISDDADLEAFVARRRRVV